MFTILSNTLRTALSGSAPRHQRLSYEEWEHRFLPRKRHGSELRRFDRNRDLW